MLDPESCSPSAFSLCQPCALCPAGEGQLEVWVEGGGRSYGRRLARPDRGRSALNEIHFPLHIRALPAASSTWRRGPSPPRPGWRCCEMRDCAAGENEEPCWGGGRETNERTGGEGNQTREKGRRRRWRNRERLKPSQLSHLHRVRTRLRRLGFVSFCWSPRRRARRACCASWVLCVWWRGRPHLHRDPSQPIVRAWSSAAGCPRGKAGWFPIHCPLWLLFTGRRGALFSAV
ncbi:hypothetical protein BKA56DRAFT_46421 [Ilyonectria sp. MPI-CAGE-AT-0026]|nr:hypothetical protein BKA56DRAFT_46421 [Ilyonectria sp. MPI-CAGE-AT-0026]